jgi:hypothetical protein
VEGGAWLEEVAPGSVLRVELGPPHPVTLFCIVAAIRGAVSATWSPP